MAAVLFNQVLKVPQGHVLQAVFLKLGVLASSLLSRFWVFLMWCVIFPDSSLALQLNFHLRGSLRPAEPPYGLR
ncbi:hypothetical protein B0H12DRAFT_1122924 [Mycena haematopus]|nr:hypothetical protein B0H12DRAFT_1163475 [Mycena haematopus]KAJ7248828.1 hypothetical protein B0H12DRAFT_1122924 [Mycena haematopus]